MSAIAVWDGVATAEWARREAEELVEWVLQVQR